jgi:hypothetical protein
MSDFKDPTAEPPQKSTVREEGCTRADWYELLLDEPVKGRFEMGYMSLTDIVEFRIGKAIATYDSPDDFSTTTTLTLFTRSGAFFTILVYCDDDLKIYEGNQQGRVIPTRRYVPIEA